MPNDRDDLTSVPSGFPGGRPRLPRLNSHRGEHVGPVDREIRSRPATNSEATGQATTDTKEGETIDVEGTFSDYFSTESLFTASPDPDDDFGDPNDVYAVLGVTRRSSWKEISRAHRELVAMLHPDRYVDADEETREAAECRVRDVNEAFSQIRRERSPSRC